MVLFYALGLPLFIFLGLGISIILGIIGLSVYYTIVQIINDKK